MYELIIITKYRKRHHTGTKADMLKLLSVVSKSLFFRTYELFKSTEETKW